MIIALPRNGETIAPRPTPCTRAESTAPLRGSKGEARGSNQACQESILVRDWSSSLRPGLYSGRSVERIFRRWNSASRSAFLVDLSLRFPREARKRLDDDAPALGTPRPGDGAVDEKRPDRVQRLGREDARPVRSLGRIAVRRAWTSSVASQVGRNRTGAGVSGSGSGARGRSTSSRAARRRESGGDARVSGERRPELEAGPVRDLPRTRRAERAEIAANEVL